MKHKILQVYTMNLSVKFTKTMKTKTPKFAYLVTKISVYLILIKPTKDLLSMLVTYSILILRIG